MRKRTFVNPVFDDKVTLLKSSDDTGGRCSLFEIEVAPGGGNSLHIHNTYSEKFSVIEGELTVHLDRNTQRLTNGQSSLVPCGTVHCFTNKSAKPVKFRVELRPGQRGFERALAISYGLAEDGMVNKKGIPKSFSYLSILIRMSGTTPAGIAKIFMPLLHWIAERSQKTEAALIRKYC